MRDGWVLGLRRGRSDTAEAAVALRVVGDRGEEIGFGEIRPELGSDVDLGVAELPEEKIGKAEFARGADQEIGVGDVLGVEAFGDEFGRDPGFGQLAFRGVADEGSDGIDEFGSTAVTEGEREGELRISGGGFNGAVQALLTGSWEVFQATDRLQTNAFFHHFRRFVVEKAVEKPHESTNFGGWALPVFGGKSVEGKEFDPRVATSFDAFANGLRALMVPLDARKTT